MSKKINPNYKSFIDSIKENKDQISQNISKITEKNEFKDDNLINDALLNVKDYHLDKNEMINKNLFPSMNDVDPNSNNVECPYTHKTGNVSGCPFMGNQNKETANKSFEYHYEIPMPETVRDFYFNKMNYIMNYKHLDMSTIKQKLNAQKSGINNKNDIKNNIKSEIINAININVSTKEENIKNNENEDNHNNQKESESNNNKEKEEEKKENEKEEEEKKEEEKKEEKEEEKVDLLEKSKNIRNMQNYLRNTLFIKNEKIKEIRTKEFSVIFLIVEDLKEKAYNLYKSNNYVSAISSYTLIYSILKWIEIKDDTRRQKLIDHFDYDYFRKNPILDDDIKICQIQTDPAMKFEGESYKTLLIQILKSLSYCYMNLRHYKQAIKCMDEAYEYAYSSKPDVLFRKCQAIMYNKFSKLEDLENAYNLLNQAKKDKDEILSKLDNQKNYLLNKYNKNKENDEKVFIEHFKELENLIIEKKYFSYKKIKILIDNTLYAANVIQKKNLNVYDTIYLHYDDIHFNFQILIEMKDTYYSSIKFFQDTQNEKALKKTIDEFDNFCDLFILFSFYYKLDISKYNDNDMKYFTQDDKNNIYNIVKDKNSMLLFNDFKYKECEKLYNDFDWNMTIWKYCFGIVNDREKKRKEEIKKKEKELKKKHFWKMVVSPFQNRVVKVTFSLIFLFITLLIIGFHVMYYQNKDEDIKKNF